MKSLSKTLAAALGAAATSAAMILPATAGASVVEPQVVTPQVVTPQVSGAPAKSSSGSQSPDEKLGDELRRDLEKHYAEKRRQERIDKPLEDQREAERMAEEEEIFEQRAANEEVAERTAQADRLREDLEARIAAEQKIEDLVGRGLFERIARAAKEASSGAGAGGETARNDAGYSGPQGQPDVPMTEALATVDWILSAFGGKKKLAELVPAKQ